MALSSQLFKNIIGRQSQDNEKRNERCTTLQQETLQCIETGMNLTFCQCRQALGIGAGSIASRYNTGAEFCANYYFLLVWRAGVSSPCPFVQRRPIVFFMNCLRPQRGFIVYFFTFCFVERQGRLCFYLIVSRFINYNPSLP